MKPIPLSLHAWCPFGNSHPVSHLLPRARLLRRAGAAEITLQAAGPGGGTAPPSSPAPCQEFPSAAESALGSPNTTGTGFVCPAATPKSCSGGQPAARSAFRRGGAQRAHGTPLSGHPEPPHAPTQRLPKDPLDSPNPPGGCNSGTPPRHPPGPARGCSPGCPPRPAAAARWRGRGGALPGSRLPAPPGTAAAAAPWEGWGGV